MTDSTVDVTCNNDIDGKIFLTVTTQPLGNTYGIDWDIDNFIGATPPDLDGLQDSIVQTDLAAGVYFVRVTDSANQCITIHSDTVYDPGPIVLNPKIDSITCFGLSNGKAWPENISGGNGGYQYLWNDPLTQITDTAFSLPIGSYRLIVTDLLSCQDSMDVNIFQPDSIYLTLSQDSVTCFSDSNGYAFADSISGGNGAYQYTWNLFAQLLDPANANNDSIFNLEAKTYRLTVLDSKGCSTSDTIRVLQPEPLIIFSINQDSVSCFGGSSGQAFIDSLSGGNKGYEYLWSSGDTTIIATNLTAGNYTVTLKDYKGCSYDSSINVLEPAPMIIVGFGQDSVNCFADSNGYAFVDSISGGNGGYNFLWNTLPTQSTDTIFNLGAGLYQSIITDRKGCKDTVDINVLEPDSIVFGTLSTTDISCFGDSTGSAFVGNITGGNGSYLYSWNLTPNQTDTLATNLNAGTYTFTLIDNKGCEKDTTFVILEPGRLSIDSTRQDSVLCFGDSTGSALIALISGGNSAVSYSWSDTLGNILAALTDSLAINLPAGSYKGIIEDSLGCRDSTIIQVLQPVEFKVDTLSISSPFCTSTNDGSITMDINGGVSPYSFNWTNLTGNFIDSVQDLNNLLPGTYYLNVLDFNNCNAKDTVTLVPGIEIIVNAGLDTLVCIGDSINLVGSSSGTTNPVVSWNFLGSSISNDSITNYTFDSITNYDFVYIVSDQACIVQDSIQISVVSLPNVDAGNDTVLGLGAIFNLGGAPTGPPGSSYLWSPLTDFSNLGDATFENPEITMFNSETYTVIVTDSNGCISSDQIFVDLIPDIVVPSGFSPNGDGINDTWIIANISQFSSNSIRVYNRWGSLIYDKDKAGQDWSGNGANNKPIPVGTYYYVIEWTDYDGKKVSLNGPVTIIR